MTETTARTSARTWVMSTSTIAALSSTLLAVDNLLGFVDAHLFGAGTAPVVAASAVLVAVACVALSAWTRDFARGIGAAAVLGFVLALSPAFANTSWLPTWIPVHTLVPLGFAACAIVVRHGSARPALRASSTVMAALALAWAVGTLVPSRLEVFLALQAATLLMTTVLAAAPWLRRMAVTARSLWDTAAVR
jgi:hypothetical protein